MVKSIDQGLFYFFKLYTESESLFLSRAIRGGESSLRAVCRKVVPLSDITACS